MAIDFPTSPNEGDILEVGEGRYWIFNGTSWDSSVYPDEYKPVTYAGEESVTFPNGMIMKHGVTTTTSNATAVTFGTAFTTVIGVQVTPQETPHSSAELAGASSVSTTGFNILSYRGTSGGSVGDVYWQAWGY